MVFRSLNRVSDTQTHQIAARKEEQMKTFRAALGLGSLDDTEQAKEEISDPSRNRREGQNADIKRHEKSEHSFLDRELNWKKHGTEDQYDDKDDKKGFQKS